MKLKLSLHPDDIATQLTTLGQGLDHAVGHASLPIRIDHQPITDYVTQCDKYIALQDKISLTPTPEGWVSPSCYTPLCILAFSVWYHRSFCGDGTAYNCGAIE